MIAHFDDFLAGEDAASTGEPLATMADPTVASFATLSDTLNQVGELTIEHGVGQPLAVFQTLIATYRALATARAALAIHVFVMGCSYSSFQPGNQ